QVADSRLPDRPVIPWTQNQLLILTRFRARRICAYPQKVTDALTQKEIVISDDMLGRQRQLRHFPCDVQTFPESIRLWMRQNALEPRICPSDPLVQGVQRKVQKNVIPGRRRRDSGGRGT